MLSTYDRAFWQRGIDITRESVSAARETIFFLHVAKSGGSSFVSALATSPHWRSAEFPYPPSTTPSGPRSNRWGRAHVEPWLSELESVRNRMSPRRGLLVWGGHPTFDHMRWLAEELTPDEHQPQVLSIFRPTRDRAISRFRDYWARAAIADLPPRLAARYNRRNGTLSLEKFRQDIQEFKADSMHYRDANGAIDGRLWFHTVLTDPGFPFLLKDIFGPVENLAEALTSGTLTLIPTSTLDVEISRLTGTHPSRVRVSPALPAEVARAIEQSAELISQMADADAQHEEVVRAYFARQD
jgi:hypothetical protein